MLSLLPNVFKGILDRDSGAVQTFCDTVQQKLNSRVLLLKYEAKIELTSQGYPAMGFIVLLESGEYVSLQASMLGKDCWEVFLK